MKNRITEYLGRLQQRWVMTVVGMLGVTMAFTMRACLGITMTQMVMPAAITDASVVPTGICPAAASSSPSPDLTDRTFAPSSAGASAAYSGDRFAWDERTQGMIMSAFYSGYIITHIPGGLLAQKFGGKFIVAYAIFSTSALTLLTPAAARMGSTHLMILRFVEGLGEGTMFPALCTLLAQWAPPHEKGKLSTLVFAGVQLGNIFANLFSGLIIEYVPGGWPNVFYCFGTIALVWLSIWLTIVFNDPLSHPFISETEREYLQKTIGCVERKKDLSSTPWKAIFSTPAVWALIVAQAGFDWGGYTLISDLPKYMNDVLHFPVSQNGLLSAIPFLAQWVCSVLSGILADFIVKKRFLTVTTIRKIYAAIGTIAPGLGMMGASFVGCDRFAATLCFTVGMALMGLIYPSIRINSLDLSPNYSASLIGVVNGIGCLSGMAAPYVAGVLTPNRTIDEWRLVFWIVLGILVTSAVTYGIFGSGELQSWNDGDATKCEKEQNDIKPNVTENTICSR